MKSPNKKINELVQYLPEKDKNIALKLIAKRDFNSLKELVDSCIKKIEKTTNTEEYINKFASLDLDKIYELAGIIVDYLLLIGDFEEQIEDEY